MTWHWLAAQCVMCFRTAAAQQAERSRVLNSGIVILLVPPIVVLAGILLRAFRRSPATEHNAPDGPSVVIQSEVPTDPLP
jgi:hypothetical protein